MLCFTGLPFHASGRVDRLKSKGIATTLVVSLNVGSEVGKHAINYLHRRTTEIELCPRGELRPSGRTKKCQSNEPNDKEVRGPSNNPSLHSPSQVRCGDQCAIQDRTCPVPTCVPICGLTREILPNKLMRNEPLRERACRSGWGNQ
jgi:hypothetical protein